MRERKSFERRCDLTRCSSLKHTSLTWNPCCWVLAEVLVVGVSESTRWHRRGRVLHHRPHHHRGPLLWHQEDLDDLGLLHFHPCWKVRFLSASISTLALFVYPVSRNVLYFLHGQVESCHLSLVVLMYPKNNVS